MITESLGASAPGFDGQSASSSSRGGRLRGKYHPRPAKENLIVHDAG